MNPLSLKSDWSEIESSLYIVKSTQYFDRGRFHETKRNVFANGRKVNKNNNQVVGNS